MSTALPAVPYPNKDFTLWDEQVSDDRRLKILNPDLFPVDEVLESLGLRKHPLAKSFGLADEDEIRARQEIGRMLLQRPDLRRWCRQVSVPEYLPRREAEFLDFNDPQREHNPFWTVVHTFLREMRALDRVPTRLQTVVDSLTAGLSLEQAERNMAADITARLQTVSVLEGMFSFRVQVEERDLQRELLGFAPESSLMGRLTLDPIDGQVFGHQLYSQSLTSVRELEPPHWTEQRFNPLNWIGIGRLMVYLTKLQNKQRRLAAFREMVVTSPTEEMWADVQHALRRRLEQLTIPDQYLHDAAVKVHFTYTKEGLFVQVVDIDVETGSVDISHTITNQAFEGFTPAQAGALKRARLEYHQALSAARAAVARDRLRSEFNRVSPGFFETNVRVDSLRLDRSMRWFAIDNMYQGPEHHDTYAAISEYRQFFQLMCRGLSQIAELYDVVINRAKELNVPVCSPVILDDGHSVNFTNLIPMQLLSRMKKGEVVAINGLPEMNGQMVAVTGHHGGGKTETLVAVPTAIWCAQSGLPVLADSFSLNPKRVLGQVFIDRRGVGSTVQQLVQRTANILKGIKDVDGRHVVLVLDEVGSATQEASGYELGRDLLDALAKRHVTVLFSTQITSLAEYAQRSLQAITCKIDGGHQITPGIGDGGMKDVRRQSGLDRLLAN